MNPYTSASKNTLYFSLLSAPSGIPCLLLTGEGRVKYLMVILHSLQDIRGNFNLF